METRFKISIGDWSSDGHGTCEYFVYQANKTIDELRQAYKDSCKLTQIQFNHFDENYIGIPKPEWSLRKLYSICTEYQHCTATKEQHTKLKSFGLDLARYSDDILEEENPDEYVNLYNPALFSELILDFCKLSLPDLEYEEAAFKNSELKGITPFNGWWNDALNVQMGYGMFE
jgi:hypothetical protein